MPAKTITIPQIGVVHFYKRRGARSLRVTLAGNGEVRVSLPFWVPYAKAIEFTLDKQTWIQQHRRERIVLQTGNPIGKAHRLVLSAAAIPSVTTRLRGNEIWVHYPAQLDPGDPVVQKAATAACLRALKKESLQLLPLRLATLAKQHGFRYSTVHIKPLKTRWGSCSHQREIVLNIYLIQLPWQLIDYVLLHELIHTKVLSHGPAFWDEFTKHLAEAKQLRKAIREFQPTLLPRAM